MEPLLLKEVESLDIRLPYDLPYMDLLRTRWQERLAKYHREEIHHGPSSLKYSLEGIQDIVDWKRILEIQSQAGSFLSSPASTARLLAHRRHEMPRILEQLLEKFGSFVPCMYPVDIFERLLVVDNIEHLGIDRHFEKEINEFLDFVYSHWNEKGIGCNSLNSIADLEITALGFQLLRLHRYNVTPVVFKNLAEGSNGQFLGLEDQFNKEVANMLSLYQASELAFPGENIMDETEGFATQYLRQALTRNETFSAWNRKRNLSREIEYTLETSWYASLPRLETKRYCQVYRPDYVRLAKGIYR